MRAVIAIAFGLLVGCANDPSYRYTPCASNDDCMGRARCETIAWRDGSGGLCTAGCNGEGDCPFHGRCLDVTRTGTFFCFAPCSSDPECSSTFICQPITTDGAVCLPGP